LYIYNIQFICLQNLYEVAENIKITKESLRIETLKTDLQNIHGQLREDNGTCLPLSPSKLVFGINVQTCAYFPSFTLPLKINFISCDNVINPAIFKVCFRIICENYFVFIHCIYFYIQIYFIFCNTLASSFIIYFL